MSLPRLHPLDLLALLAAVNPGINPDSDDARRAVAGAMAILEEVAVVTEPEVSPEAWPKAALDRIEWWIKLVNDALATLQRDGGLLEACRARMVEIDILGMELAKANKNVEQLQHWREEVGKVSSHLGVVKDENEAFRRTILRQEDEKARPRGDHMLQVNELQTRLACAHEDAAKAEERERERLVALLAGDGIGVYDYRETRDSYEALGTDGIRALLAPAESGDCGALPASLGWIARLTVARTESRREGARDMQERLLPLFEELVGQIDIPVRNCSCHLSPPCSDCVDFGGLRQSIATFRSALVSKS